MFKILLKLIAILSDSISFWHILAFAQYSPMPAIKLIQPHTAYDFEQHDAKLLGRKPVASKLWLQINFSFEAVINIFLIGFSWLNSLFHSLDGWYTDYRHHHRLPRIATAALTGFHHHYTKKTSPSRLPPHSKYTSAITDGKFLWWASRQTSCVSKLFPINFITTSALFVEYNRFTQFISLSPHFIIKYRYRKFVLSMNYFSLTTNYFIATFLTTKH